ncbi:MAG TPA: hypothetical protein VFG19_14850 [Geobacteraceae bacterium]|nr:hypothetical protein [Geobacteraceae bacterium]
MSKDKPQITFKYIFTYDYNPKYVNGAHGGVSPRGELVVNFYLERPPLPNAVSHEINPNGTIGPEAAVDPEDLNSSLVRYVSSGVVLSLQTARDLHSWLGEKIRELEALERARAAHAEAETGKGKIFS